MATVGAMALSVACWESPATPVKFAAPNESPTATISKMFISPDTIVIAQDDTTHVAAVLAMSDGTWIPTIARWTSSAPRVVSVQNSRAIGVSRGTATITASIDSLSLWAEVPALVLTRLPDSARALVVQRFFITEFQYPSLSGVWFYAPQVQVAAAPGRRVYIASLTFSIPGLDDIATWNCDAYVTAGKVVDLNGEVYGDWALSVEETEHQATGADATAKLKYYDDSGLTTTLSLRGPVVRGSLPTTYGGDPGACFSGLSEPRTMPRRSFAAR
jgi:hypothetical protein